MSENEKPRPSNLETLIRHSRLLDGVSKRRWLAVLPYLTPADRARLSALLERGGVPLEAPRRGQP